MPSKKRAFPIPWSLLIYGGLLLALIVFAFSYRIYVSQHAPKTYQETLTPITGNPEPEKTLEVGLLIDNLYVFEAEKKMFDADGWIWLKWGPQLQQKMIKKGLKPEDLFVFFNQVDDFDSMLTPSSEKPLKMSDGRFYQKFRFSGHFYVNKLDFRTYPFHAIKLPIVVELISDKLMGQENTLDLSLDQTHSGLGAYIDLSGYFTKGFDFKSYFHESAHSMSEPGSNEGPKRVPQARMEIAYQKAPVTTVLKIILPLITVMTLTLFSPSISSAGWDVRLSIPPTSILTLIFLQQTYQTWLPELPYLTFLDTLYNVCYFTNLSLFGLFLWGTNEHSKASEAEKPSVTAKVDRIDRYFQIGLTLIIVIMGTLNWFVLSHQAN